MGQVTLQLIVQKKDAFGGLTCAKQNWALLEVVRIWSFETCGIKLEFLQTLSQLSPTLLVKTFQKAIMWDCFNEVVISFV